MPSAATQLAALRADLQEVLERSPAMIGLWNGDRTCRFANTAYAAAHGLSPEQMVGRHVAEVLGEEAYGRSAPLIEAALAGTPQSFERVLRQADGSLRHELVNYVPDSRSGGQPGLVVFVSDITRRVRAEEATREVGQRFRTLYERTPAMVHSIDPHGCLLSVSDRWLRRLGYAADEVLGRPITAFLKAESGPRTSAAQLLHFLRDGGPVEDMECQVACKDGTLIDVLLSATAERDADGQFQRGLAVMVDVTARNRAMAALRESETFLDRAGRVAGVGAWSLDLASGRVTWSDQTCRIHEVEPGYQPRVEDALRFYRDGARQRITQAVQACIEHQIPYDIELELVTATGREIWVRAAGEADATDGSVSRIFGSFQDITARRQAEIALSGQHELLRVTLDSIGDAVITTDAAGIVEWLNPVAARLTGWLLEEARGRPIEQVFNILHEETRQPASSPVARALRDECTVGLAEHTVLVSRDEVERGIEDSAAPIRAPDGRLLGVVLVFHDVSEQRRLAREVNWRATRDGLTGLLNRSEFDLRLRRAHAGARDDHQEHALMYIDLDQFKLVNDACGHAAGDQLLREVSALLQSVVRSRDTLARLGGDEFAVIMEHCTVVQARRVAQQLCDRMEQYRFLHDDRRFRIGASIGLVPLDARWTGTAEVMQAADAACYAAKDAGRNRVHEWYDTDRAMQERHGEMQWATRLEQALDENRFRLHGQRITPVGGPDGQVLHLEVLLRLQKRDGSIVAPGAFLPAAERFNMATRIDRWVLREVLAWMAAQDLDRIGLVAVNLSGRSLGDRSFHRFAAELLGAVPFDPRKLCLEITETAAITHLGDAATFMAAMRALGVRIALDDFGAGASSFGYLKNLPVDFLKIDGQFVRDLLDDELDRTAVRCFREVAAVCGVHTIAECVESVAVLEELARIGIDFAQGFLLHRPEPLDALVAAALTPDAAG
ncbi:MAG: EAL domain-containing protein [Pseudomonadota bacterium]|nr:EAL domain-containing protein [Pseudomonadota bacterium]